MYTEEQLGFFDLAKLQKINSNLKTKIAGNMARNNQRLINISDLKSMDNHSVEKVREGFFRGSVQEINTVIWPFLFPSETVKVEGGNEVSSKIQISAEAAFVVTGIKRVVYKEVIIPAVDEFTPERKVLEYIDPSGDKVCEGLKFEINDLSSERSFTDKAIDLNALGHSQEVFKLNDSPFMLQPNQNLEFRISSEIEHTYYVQILLEGYRVRIEDASTNSLATVTL